MKTFLKASLEQALRDRGLSPQKTWVALGFKKDRYRNFRLVETVFHPSESSPYRRIEWESETGKLWDFGLKSVAIYLLVAASTSTSANDPDARLVDSMYTAQKNTWVHACHSNVSDNLGNEWQVSDESPWAQWRHTLFRLERVNGGNHAPVGDGLTLLCEPGRPRHGQSSTPMRELRIPDSEHSILPGAILVFVFEAAGPVEQSLEQMLTIAEQIESQAKRWKRRVSQSFLRHGISHEKPPQTTSANPPAGDTFINAKLERLGAKRHSELYDEAFEKLFGDRLILYDAILDGAISGFAGVPPDRLRVTMTRAEPALPQYVLDYKQASAQPHPNKRKIYLAGWTPPIIDSGHFLTLTLGHTDYWTNVSVQECRNRLHEDILKGNRDLFTLPRGLDVPMVVMTTNDQIAFCRRADHPVVRNCPLHWDVSIGEGVNADEDIDESGQIHPLCTLKRGLYEEMGIPNAIASEASIKFVAIATEWPLLLANLFAFVRLPIDSVELRNLWLGKVDQEHIDFDTADLNLDVCLNIVIRGTYQRANIPASKGPLHAVARLGLFAALCSHFSYQTVLERLDSM